MPRLAKALAAWSSENFQQTLKDELKQLPHDQLPLHLGLAEGGLIDAEDLEVCVLGSQAADTAITARVACFFTEVVGGCSCHDAPYTRNAACELLVRIDRQNGEADFSPLTDTPE